MTKPEILVTAASGKTSAATALQLFESGQELKNFETAARRYFVVVPNVKRNLGGLSRMVLGLMKVILTPGLDLAKYNRIHDFPQIRRTRFVIDSPDWRQTHGDNGKALTEALKVLVEAIRAGQPHGWIGSSTLARVPIRQCLATLIHYLPPSSGFSKNLQTQHDLSQASRISKPPPNCGRWLFFTRQKRLFTGHADSCRHFPRQMLVFPGLCQKLDP